MAMQHHNRPDKPERIVEARPPMDASRYMTDNLLAQIAAHEGFYCKVSGDTKGTQIGFGFNRGSKTCQVASAVLSRPIVKGSIISHQDAVDLAKHKVGEKIKQNDEKIIGQERFDKLSANAQAAVISVLYNCTDKAATGFSKKVCEKIDLDQTAGIPALISSFATMPGTAYHKGLKTRRQDEARLAMTPDGEAFAPSKQVYDHHAKKNIPAETIAALIRPETIADGGNTDDKTDPTKRIITDAPKTIAEAKPARKTATHSLT